MMKSLKQQLSLAGFETTTYSIKKKRRFKILHILSGAYLMEYNPQTETIGIAIAYTQGRAGQIRDAYRYGESTGKSNGGKTVVKFYFLEEDLGNKLTHPLWYITYIRMASLALSMNPRDSSEFEIIEIED